MSVSTFPFLTFIPHPAFVANLPFHRSARVVTETPSISVIILYHSLQLINVDLIKTWNVEPTVREGSLCVPPRRSLSLSLSSTLPMHLCFFFDLYTFFIPPNLTRLSTRELPCTQPLWYDLQGFSTFRTSTRENSLLETQQAGYSLFLACCMN